MSTTALASVGIPDFHRLSTTASVYFPPATPTISAAKPDTKLIVICSWFGAAIRNVAKYVQGHQAAHPDAPILLCESSTGSMFMGNDLHVAAELVRAHPGPAVLHVFSNGGGVTVTQLVDALGPDASTTHPFATVILDSCPGTATVQSATRAMSYAVPKSVRPVAEYVLWGAFVVYMLVFEALRWEDQVSRLRRRLNDRAVLPQRERLYLYSEADELVPTDDVRRHAADAREKGIKVREEVFRTAPHCGLIIEDAGRYWKVVNDFIHETCASFKAMNV